MGGQSVAGTLTEWAQETSRDRAVMTIGTRRGLSMEIQDKRHTRSLCRCFSGECAAGSMPGRGQHRGLAVALWQDRTRIRQALLGGMG